LPNLEYYENFSGVIGFKYQLKSNHPLNMKVLWCITIAEVKALGPFLGETLSIHTHFVEMRLAFCQFGVAKFYF